MDWRYALAAGVIGGTALSLWAATKPQSRALSGAEPPFLMLETIDRYVPAMKREGVSEVARSRRGFLPAYRRARGRADRLPARWKRKRRAFIARHMGQVRTRREPLYTKDGEPTRRHLSLIAWAYSPSPGGL